MQTTEPGNTALAASRRIPKKVEPGSELHLTLLMAKYDLNLVTGADRKDLLAWGRDVWDAAKAANVEIEGQAASGLSRSNAGLDN